jgi:hypothetical protein
MVVDARNAGIVDFAQNSRFLIEQFKLMQMRALCQFDGTKSMRQGAVPSEPHA